jgi:hypothetical protein
MMFLTIRKGAILGSVFCMAGIMYSPAFADTVSTDNYESICESTETTIEENYTYETTALQNSNQQIEVPVEKNSLSFQVSVVDKDTLMPIPNLTVHLEKRWYENVQEGQSHSECYTGETEILETWNTSDANPYTSQTYEYTPEQPFDVWAVIDELPEAYSFYGEDLAEICWNYLRVSDQQYSGIIQLQKEKYTSADFPIKGSFKAMIRVEDSSTHEPIRNLDCILVNPETNEEILAWNTSNKPVVEIPNLEYCFEDRKMRSTIRYEVHILNAPENYEVEYYDSAEKKLLIRYSLTAFEAGAQEEFFTIGMQNQDSPPVTEITTSPFDNTTTTETTVFTNSTDITTTIKDTTTATSESETVTTTVTSRTDEVLPQTGMSGFHTTLTALAAIMGITGICLINKSRKEDEN